MRRREFIGLLGAAAIVSPRVALGQQTGRVPQIGVLLATYESDPGTKRSIEALERGLQEIGLRNGPNIHLVYRFGTVTADLAAKHAKELVDLKPDLIVVATSPGVAAVLRETRTIPVVFVNVADPVGSGFISTFARPGGNITGFSNFESSMSGKWLEILKEIAPTVRRVLILHNPETAPDAAYFPSLNATAPLVSLELFPAPVHDPAEIDVAVSSFAKEPNGGVIAFPDIYMFVHRQVVIGLTAKYALPAVYGFARFVRDGGLVSYGLDNLHPYHQAASYVDRILKGANPGELPVQGPVKFEMAINLKTAKALGLTIPQSFLLRADEVIE
jgi:putative tryptophan/tyrosine transport system substrate-binding protein